MSQRYVWSKNNIVLVEAQDNLVFDQRNSFFWDIDVYEDFPYVNYGPGNNGLTKPYYASYGTAYTFQNGKFYITNPVYVEPSESPNGLYGLTVTAGNRNRKIYVGYSEAPSESIDGYSQLYYLTFYDTYDNDVSYYPIDTDRITAAGSGGVSRAGQPLWLHTQASKGTSAGTVSNASSGAYPADAGRLERRIQHRYQQASAHWVHTDAHTQDE